MSRDQKPGRSNIVSRPAAVASAQPVAGSAAATTAVPLVADSKVNPAPPVGLLVVLFIVTCLLAGAAVVAVPWLLQ